MDRSEFRKAVFGRDGHKCVVCGSAADAAHHILERRLFADGGYTIGNGVSLCARCHARAEQTLLTPAQLREAAGIRDRVLPDHLYPDYEYDKWGNICLPNGYRLRGELYYDESVQRILPDEIKHSFIFYVKHPKTYHVPWTQSATSDDKIHTYADMAKHFTGHDVVVTEKMDGEQSSIYYDGYFHARSIDGNSHPSQDWLKNFAHSWYYDLPTGWRVCGENLYATHTLYYDSLPSYFEVFGVWDRQNLCLSWDDTKEWCELLGLQTVPELWRGLYNTSTLQALAKSLDTEHVEGYVIRATGFFTYAEYRYRTAKFVREGHVQTSSHNWRMRWRPDKVNKLKKQDHTKV